MDIPNCKVCRKSIDLSNMGQRALISHMKSKKHSDSVAVRSGTSAQQSIEACFSTSSTSKPLIVHLLLIVTWIAQKIIILGEV